MSPAIMDSLRFQDKIFQFCKGSLLFGERKSFHQLYMTCDSKWPAELKILSLKKSSSLFSGFYFHIGMIALVTYYES